MFQLAGVPGTQTQTITAAGTYTINSPVEVNGDAYYLSYRRPRRRQEQHLGIDFRDSLHKSEIIGGRDETVALGNGRTSR